GWSSRVCPSDLTRLSVSCSTTSCWLCFAAASRVRAARGSHNAGSVNRDVLHRSYRPGSDVNIVTDCLDGQALDLVIATNVFIYYDVFEQALAMSNVEAM